MLMLAGCAGRGLLLADSPPWWLVREFRREQQNLFNRLQINDSSVQQQCAEGHFRKHTSFNLELDGLKQHTAAAFHSSQQRTRK